MTIESVTLESGDEYKLRAGEEWVITDPDNQREPLALELIDAATDGVQFKKLNQSYLDDGKDAMYNVVDIDVGEFMDMARNGEIVPLQKMNHEWDEVRRSVPATEERLVDDDAIDYEVWILKDEDRVTVDALTIYAAGDGPDKFWLIRHDEEQTAYEKGEFDEYEDAKERLEELKPTIHAEHV